MATIEPWLTNLLNNPKTPEPPPVQPGPRRLAPAHSLSLPPLGPELAGGHRADRPAPTNITALCTADGNRLVKPPARADGTSGQNLTASIRPLQLLLRAPEPAIPLIPLRTIVDDVPRSPEDASTKKRHRALTTKEDFVQLPKLPKKQRSAPQVVPPIIAGLHEPPPDPAVFPPITSAPFDENEAFGLGPRKDLGSGPRDRLLASSAGDAALSNPPKAKRRPMKPRRKWTEEETNNLLLGVSRHGVGKWTAILEDPDFNFNGRTAGDLKDRFRTCCPEELRLTATETSRARPTDTTGASTGPEGNPRHKNGLHLEDILIPTSDGAPGADEPSPPAHPDTDAARKRRKTRAHRKKLEDLAELGIHGPFEKSHRRRRRPFTKRDDEEILDGLKHYGPSWTRIQRDPRYNLSSRQPTDLRDRVRNKYPEIYATIEKANLMKEAARGKANTTLEPSVHLAAENPRHVGPAMLGPIAVPPSSSASGPSSSLETQLSRSRSKEDIVLRRTTAPAAYESTESLPALADLFDMSAEHHGPPGSL